ncbi:MAG: cobalamin biosynthesis protein CobU [Frankia sp.]|nr:cobalamin biosynthesis protein CobU [Frankia sp.]
MARVTLLGTGSADGWPNPWCDCSSCAWARANGVIRHQTGVLVDDAVLIDIGPDVTRSAARLGLRLGGVRHLLVGHAHADHIGPEALMWRSWSTAAEAPLDLVGPPAVLDVVQAFLARWEGRPRDDPGPPLRLWPAVAGSPVEVGDYGARYHVRPVPARHGDASIGPAVLYDVTTPDGARLLYGCDTGPLPADALAALAGRAFDIALMEENNGDRPGFGEHLDLATLAVDLDRLRANGALTAASTVVAVHLSHRNPPGDELAERLARLGVELLPDGAVLDVTPGSRAAITH